MPVRKILQRLSRLRRRPGEASSLKQASAPALIQKISKTPNLIPRRFTSQPGKAPGLIREALLMKAGEHQNKTTPGYEIHRSSYLQQGNPGPKLSRNLPRLANFSLKSTANRQAALKKLGLLFGTNSALDGGNESGADFIQKQAREAVTKSNVERIIREIEQDPSSIQNYEYQLVHGHLQPQEKQVIRSAIAAIRAQSTLSGRAPAAPPPPAYRESSARQGYRRTTPLEPLTYLSYLFEEGLPSVSKGVFAASVPPPSTNITVPPRGLQPEIPHLETKTPPRKPGPKERASGGPASASSASSSSSSRGSRYEPQSGIVGIPYGYRTKADAENDIPRIVAEWGIADPSELIVFHRSGSHHPWFVRLPPGGKRVTVARLTGVGFRRRKQPLTRRPQRPRRTLPKSLASDQACNDLEVMIGERNSGNDSKIMKNRIADLAQWLLLNKQISKDFCKQILNNYVLK